MIAYVAALIALLGLLLYVLASNSKVVEVGRIVFFCGMLATALQLATRTVKLF